MGTFWLVVFSAFTVLALGGLALTFALWLGSR
jgi:hypothetical protein